MDTGIVKRLWLSGVTVTAIAAIVLTTILCVSPHSFVQDEVVKAEIRNGIYTTSELDYFEQNGKWPESRYEVISTTPASLIGAWPLFAMFWAPLLLLLFGKFWGSWLVNGRI